MAPARNRPNVPGVTILHEPKSWRRERSATETRRSTDLTPDEQAAVRRALHTLRLRLGGWKALAKALRVNVRTLTTQGGTRGRPSAAVAIRAAKLADVSVTEILEARWPKEGSCPHCGRG